MSKKSTTTQSSTTNTAGHMTQTPTNPDWVSNGLAGLGGSIMDLSKLDPSSLVAGPSAQQLQAGEGASNLQGRPWLLDAAVGHTADVLGANAPRTAGVQSIGYMDQYMSPYLANVVKNTLAEFDQNANQTRQGQMLDLANDSTFGGSGGSILRALTEGQLAQKRAGTAATLRDQGFQTALSAANADAQRAQGANDLNAQLEAQRLDRVLAGAGQLVGLSNSYDANQRANIGTQGDIGAALQEIAQRKALSPLSLLGTQAALFSGLPLGLLHGQEGDTTSNSNSNGTSTTTVSDPMGTFGSLLAGAGSLASGLGAMGIGFGKVG